MLAKNLLVYYFILIFKFCLKIFLFTSLGASLPAAATNHSGLVVVQYRYGSRGCSTLSIFSCRCRASSAAPQQHRQPLCYNVGRAELRQRQWRSESAFLSRVKGTHSGGECFVVSHSLRDFSSLVGITCCVYNVLPFLFPQNVFVSLWIQIIEFGSGSRILAQFGSGQKK